MNKTVKRQKLKRNSEVASSAVGHTTKTSNNISLILFRTKSPRLNTKRTNDANNNKTQQQAASADVFEEALIILVTKKSHPFTKNVKNGNTSAYNVQILHTCISLLIYLLFIHI